MFCLNSNFACHKSIWNWWIYFICTLWWVIEWLLQIHKNINKLCNNISTNCVKSSLPIKFVEFHLNSNPKLFIQKVLSTATLRNLRIICNGNIFIDKVDNRLNILFIFQEVEIKTKSKLIKMQILNRISWIIDPHFKDRRLMYQNREDKSSSLAQMSEFVFVILCVERLTVNTELESRYKWSFSSTTCLNSHEHFYQIYDNATGVLDVFEMIVIVN